MAIYTIGDLHLSFSQDKPMSIFGENWEGHAEKIKENWLKKVTTEDTVILPGDFSWAMYLEDTFLDFSYLNALPGKKILLKGNHDYWWTTITNMNKYIKENGFSNISFLYNNSYLVEDKIIAGTRGWSLLDTDNSKKMLQRECNRLRLSIEQGIEQYGSEKEIYVFMHYPPVTNASLCYADSNAYLQVMQEHFVRNCYYGHLHGTSHREAIEGNIDGVTLKLVSADYLDFNLYEIR